MRVTLLVLELAAAGGMTFAGAALIPPFSVLLIVFALVCIVERFRARWRESRRSEALIALAGSVIVVASLLVVAALHRPSKTTEWMLDRRIELHSQQMTLAELDFYCTYDRPRFPLRISLAFADKRKNATVRWDQPEPTLREFLAALRRQVGLQHKFGHCGNGWTLLHGGDCSFGLFVWDPDVTGPAPEPQFETGSYVPEAYQPDHRSNQPGPALRAKDSPSPGRVEPKRGEGKRGHDRPRSNPRELCVAW